MKTIYSEITTIIGQNTKRVTGSIIAPRILDTIKKGQSFVVCDPKYQILNYVGEALDNESYKIIHINLREPHKSMSWNPLIPPYRIFLRGNKQEAYSFLTDVAKSIYVSLGGNQKDFWDSSAYAFFVALVSSLYDKAPEEQLNIESILNMVIMGEQKFAASNYMKEYFNLEEGSFPYISSHNVINAPSDTKGGILAVFKNSLQTLTSNGKYKSILCFNDFELEDCLKEKVAIILGYEDESSSGSEIVSIFLDMLYKFIIDKRTIQPQSDSFTFFLDDFLSIPHLYDFDEMIMSALSRNVSIEIVINNRSLFEKRYGKESMESLLTNSSNIIYFRSNDIQMYQYIVGLCEQKNIGLSENQDDLPLLISNDGMSHFLELPFLKMQEYHNSYVNKHIDGEVQRFPLKEYVKEGKRNKLFESIENEPRSANLVNDFMQLQAPPNDRKREVRNLVGSINERIHELKNTDETSS